MLHFGEWESGPAHITREMDPRHAAAFLSSFQCRAISDQPQPVRSFVKRWPSGRLVHDRPRSCANDCRHPRNGTWLVSAAADSCHAQPNLIYSGNWVCCARHRSRTLMALIAGEKATKLANDQISYRDFQLRAVDQRCMVLSVLPSSFSSRLFGSSTTLRGVAPTGYACSISMPPPDSDNNVLSCANSEHQIASIS